MTVQLPLGFRSHVANIGIKDATDDFTLVVADGTCSAAGVFTQSRFAGPSVVVSREHITNLSARAVVVISKNGLRSRNRRDDRRTEINTSMWMRCCKCCSALLLA